MSCGWAPVRATRATACRSAAWRVPLRRRWPQLAAPRPREHRAHPAHLPPPARPEHRLRLRRSAPPGARTSSAACSRRSDGGRTWEKVLYVDKKTGCANLVIDPHQPRQAVRQHVGAPALAVVVQVGRAGLGAVPHRRRRPLVDQAGPRRTACRRATSVASVWRSRGLTPTSSTRWSRRPRARSAAFRRRRRHLPHGQRRARASRRGRSTTPTSASTRRTRTA